MTFTLITHLHRAEQEIDLPAVYATGIIFMDLEKASKVKEMFDQIASSCQLQVGFYQVVSC